MQNVVGTSDETTSDHRHDLVPGATNRGHSRRQKERQQFVSRERDASELGATRAAPGQHLPDRGWASANRFRGERGAKPCTSLVPAPQVTST